MLEDMVPPPAGRTVQPCKVVKIANSLSESDGRLLLEYVADERWVAERLVAALHERGITVGAMAIRSHRKGECACKRLRDA